MFTDMCAVPGCGDISAETLKKWHLQTYKQILVVKVCTRIECNNRIRIATHFVLETQLNN